MPLTQLTETELAETVQRAREIADQGRELATPEARYEDYIHAAEEMGIPREAMLQAVRERLLIPGETLEEGQRVFAPSADGFWYPAELKTMGEQTSTVHFVTGSDHSCATADLRPMSFIPGRKLEGDCAGWGWYGCIIRRYDKKKDRVEVQHDDWFANTEWIPVKKLRLARKHVYPEKETETAAADRAKAALTRVALFAGGAGLLLGFLLDRLLPWLPFFR